jgi:glutathione synthase/RimK-type ligase-like ATP-grasp enzyme
MKKIGILYGQENTFPQAFVERVNEKAKKEKIDVMAEPVQVQKVEQGLALDYAVIIDRISQDVPFYRAMLKNTALAGTAVINNPFWWSADEKFFNNGIAMKVGVPVPRTVLLPSFALPPDTNGNSFRNLKLDWENIMNTVGFPAYMKPHSGGGWKSVYRLEDLQDFYAKHPETDQLVMLLQEEIKFDDYFRCYCLDRRDVHIMPYEPRNPHHLRYDSEVKATGAAAKKLLETVKDYVLRLNNALGYDFNTVEFAVRDGIPYAIDFCNPAPDADINSVGQKNFDWIVENAATMAIRRAKAQKVGQDNLTWGEFVSGKIYQQEPITKKTTAKEEAPKTETKEEPKKATRSRKKPE